MSWMRCVHVSSILIIRLQQSMKSNTEYSCGRVQGAMAKAEYKVYSTCRCILMNIQKYLKHKITEYVFSQFLEYNVEEYSCYS